MDAHDTVLYTLMHTELSNHVRDFVNVQGLCLILFDTFLIFSVSSCDAAWLHSCCTGP